MNVHALQSLLAAIIFLFLALFVYYQKKENPLNRSFATLILCTCIWNIDVFGILSAANAEYAMLWGKIFRPGLIFIPPTSLHFVIYFLELKQYPNLLKWLLWASYGNSIIFTVINWTPYFTGEAVQYPWGYTVQTGPFYPYFIATFFIFMLISFTLLIRNYFKADQYQKQRIKYFLIALIISFLFGSIGFLPMVGLEVYPIGSIAVTIGFFIVAYSVVQHRLMDVSVFMAKALGYILSILILAVPASLAIIFLQSYFFQQTDLSFSLLVLVIGIAAALTFSTVKESMNRAMHQIIVRDKYFYHRVLEEFSRRLVTIVDLNRLLNMLADTVERSMGVSRISIFLYNSEKEAFRLALVRGSPESEMMNIFFKFTDPSIQWLQEKKESVLRPEVERNPKGLKAKEILEMMGRLQAEVCLPLVYMDRLIGFINLGHKLAKEMYYREDLDLLNTLANQVAIAVENANLYENLKKSQGIMRRADRLASLGTLISSLAHEIRNPLVSIKTFTQLLPERMEDEEFRNYFLKVASGEIDRLTTLINELLGFARPSEPNLRGEDMNALIEKMEFLVITEARKKNISISKNFMFNLPLVMVDAEQIKQVLLNILLNAVQSTPGEGQIWVETRVVRIPREDTTVRFVQIEVRDTGVGIPKENMERVFDPFFSTRPDGSGLGLAISYQIIHEHGGFIDLESEVGKGTSFRVHLPLKDGGKGESGN
jgi:signal transduction histidine kinase